MTDSLWKPDNGYFFWDIFSHQYLIVMKPNKFSDRYWYPTTTCSYNAQSLQFLQKSLRECWPFMKDASPSLIHALLVFLSQLPPGPPCLSGYLHPLIPTPVCHLEPKLGWGGWGTGLVMRRAGPIRKEGCGFWSQT